MNAYPLDESGRCALCRTGATGFDAAYSFGSYEAELRDLIHLFKYGRVQTLARPLGTFLAAALPRTERFDYIAPVPLHWRKRWTRGFNQSHVLARELCRHTSIPVRRCVRRARFTSTQAGLSHAKRRENVSRAFRATRSLEGLRILLVDDVMTTGATAAACARALKRAGAKYVALITVARVDRRIAAVARRPEFDGFSESILPGSSENADSGPIA